MPDFSSIDTKIAAHLAAVEVAQREAFSADGKYVQLLESHTAAPAIGKTASADRQVKPEGRTKGRAELKLVAPTEWSERIDIYEGPEGKGYVTTFTVLEGKKKWSKSVNVGPETWREAQWHEVVEI